MADYFHRVQSGQPNELTGIPPMTNEQVIGEVGRTLQPLPRVDPRLPGADIVNRQGEIHRRALRALGLEDGANGVTMNGDTVNIPFERGAGTTPQQRRNAQEYLERGLRGIPSDRELKFNWVENLGV